MAGLRRAVMLNWFKRQRDSVPGPQDMARARASRRATSRPVPPTDPAPLPEVVAEGNSQADWSMWEDSMTVLDSQMGDLAASERIYERESERRYTRPAPLTETDAFGNVGKNHDV
jgi:hypothetical protein